jgi:hypothetical protein
VPRLPALPAALLAALLLTLGACSDDPPAPENGDGDAIRADLSAVFAGDHPEARDTANGDCFAEALTAALSNEQLRDAGVLDSSYDVVSPIPPLPEEVAEAWADAQISCTDFYEESARGQTHITKGRIDPEAYAECLRAEVSEEQVRAAVVDALTADWHGPDLAALSRGQAACAAEQEQGDPTAG